jgi:hypothetical protein
MCSRKPANYNLIRKMAIQVNGGLNILVEESYLLQATHRMPFLTKNKYNQNEITSIK